MLTTGITRNLTETTMLKGFKCEKWKHMHNAASAIGLIKALTSFFASLEVLFLVLKFKLIELLDSVKKNFYASIKQAEVKIACK